MLECSSGRHSEAVVYKIAQNLNEDDNAKDAVFAARWNDTLLHSKFLGSGPVTSSGDKVLEM